MNNRTVGTLEDERDALADWCIQEASAHEQSARDMNNGGFGIDEEGLARARSFRQIAALLLREPESGAVRADTGAPRLEYDCTCMDPGGCLRHPEQAPQEP